VAELRLTRRARTDLERLSPLLQEAVVATLDALARERERGKALVGRLHGLRSARVGSYRVLYTVEAALVIVRAIRHRGVAYGA
jgi:mRNA-degrading endonuclease RelE of RelBE toxin-antitoxin system